MVTRRWIAAAIAICAFPALALAPTTAATAEVAEPANAFAEVSGVVARVNRTGGITVSGEITCRAAVDAWEAKGNTVPEGILHVSYSWVARQPLKKGAYAVAEFGSSHLTPCYDTRPADQVTEVDQIFPWDSTPYGMTAPLYLYSQTGKFTKGPVYVQVTFEGGEVLAGGASLGYVEVFYQGGFEVVAQRS